MKEKGELVRIPGGARGSRRWGNQLQCPFYIVTLLPNLTRGRNASECRWKLNWKEGSYG